MKQGAYDYLTKPFQVDEINAVIGRALEKRALVEDNLALRDQLAGRVRLAQLLGKSRAMQKLFELITKIHSVRTSVLITGESGTGKELVARALHSEGSRARAPFIAVNCGRDPRGADGVRAVRPQARRVHRRDRRQDRHVPRRADGGSLFLDEIGELSLGLQVKLLRALQERRVKLVGATEELEVDVRVIAATNRDLETRGLARCVSAPTCYYRLNVIRAPAAAAAATAARTSRCSPSTSCAGSPRAPPVVEAVRPRRCAGSRATSFPGNVRELENIIERAVALSSSALIGRERPARGQDAANCGTSTTESPASGRCRSGPAGQ